MIVQPLAPNDPQTIGRYRVLGLLGSGGMGRVLLGIGPDGRFVAIKQIHSHLLDEPEYRARFRSEVSASTRVSGAFTAPVIDFDVDGHTPWLASVFVVGVPLDEAVRDFGPLPVPAVRVLAAGLAVALQEIHRSGLVHRDLKPGNVLLTADGPRVIDFGIALLAENPSGLTEAGSTLGSPAYMSPEQALAEPVSYASDMFSLGSLLVMAATGSSPFAAGSLAYTLFNIAHTAPNLEPLPPELRGLIEHTLHKNPHDRPTPSQFLGQIGWLPEQSTPWPDSIHGAIDRQTRELAELTSNPDATLVVSRSGSATSGLAALGPGSTRLADTSTRRRAARRGALVAVVVLMLMAAGIAWIRIGSDSTEPQAAVPMLINLREADACAWVRQALDGSVAVETGWPTDVSDWNLSTTWNWGCKVEAAGARMFVEAGDNVRNNTPTGRKINDLAVLGIDGTTDCIRATDLSGAADWWGVEVRVYGGQQPCGFADHMLNRLIAARGTIPVLANRSSLATIDPCGLVSWDYLNETVGPIAKKPAEFSAHSCAWQGAQTATIELRRIDNFSVERSIGLENGTRLDIEAPTKGSTLCILYYAYQNVGDQREVVKVVVDSAGSREQRCATGESIMRSLLPNLPKLN